MVPLNHFGFPLSTPAQSPPASRSQRRPVPRCIRLHLQTRLALHFRRRTIANDLVIQWELLTSLDSPSFNSKILHQQPAPANLVSPNRPFGNSFYYRLWDAQLGLLQPRPSDEEESDLWMAISDVAILRSDSEPDQFGLDLDLQLNELANRQNRTGRVSK
jgi:hypothetical protein